VWQLYGNCHTAIAYYVEINILFTMNNFKVVLYKVPKAQVQVPITPDQVQAKYWSMDSGTVLTSGTKIGRLSFTAQKNS